MTTDDQRADEPPSAAPRIVEPQGRPSRTIVFGTEQGREIMLVFVHPEEGGRSAEGEPIAAAEVSAWFHKAAPRWPVPTDGDLRSLVHLLNIMRITNPLSQDASQAKAQPLERVKGAIKTLLSDLPGLIEASQNSHAAHQDRGLPPFLSESQVQTVGELLAAARNASGSFWWPARRYRREAWHTDAIAIARSSAAAWRAVGQTRVGKNPTSPLVKVIELALARIGTASSTEAISKALQRTIRKTDLSRTT